MAERKMQMLERAHGLLCNVPSDGSSAEEGNEWRRLNQEWIDEWFHVIKAHQTKHQNARTAIGNEAIAEFEASQRDAKEMYEHFAADTDSHASDYAAPTNSPPPWEGLELSDTADSYARAGTDHTNTFMPGTEAGYMHFPTHTPTGGINPSHPAFDMLFGDHVSVHIWRHTLKAWKRREKGKKFGRMIAGPTRLAHHGEAVQFDDPLGRVGINEPTELYGVIWYQGKPMVWGGPSLVQPGDAFTVQTQWEVTST